MAAVAARGGDGDVWPKLLAPPLATMGLMGARSTATIHYLMA